MTAHQKWETDRTAHFDSARIARRSNPHPDKKQEKNPAEWTVKVPKPNPLYILGQCVGVSILHIVAQIAVCYVFDTGAVNAYGAIAGTVANCLVAGWRVCWRFKV